MADFAHLGEAMLRSQAKPPGAFLGLYHSNRRDSIARGLEASPVAAAIRSLVDNQHPTDPSGFVFEGTMSVLLEKLADHRVIKNDAWPKSARGLGDVLRRQKPALADVGVLVVILPRTRAGISVRITQMDVSTPDHPRAAPGAKDGHPGPIPGLARPFAPETTSAKRQARAGSVHVAHIMHVI